jgi:hypothetical protein
VIYGFLADLVVAFHFLFLVFVVAGGLLARRHRWIMIPHLLAIAWGLWIETVPGMACPLTALENRLAVRAGGAGYEGGFIEHYLLPVIYPEGLTRRMQVGLAVLVVVVNVLVYAWPRTARPPSRGGER